MHPLFLFSHGNGYEWDAAFKEAFRDDPNIRQIHFDSEAGSFFCDCPNLSVIMDFAKRFKALVDDTEAFTPIVSAGIRQYEKEQREYEEIQYRIKGRLMDYSNCTIDVRTVQAISD